MRGNIWLGPLNLAVDATIVVRLEPILESLDGKAMIKSKSKL